MQLEHLSGIELGKLVSEKTLSPVEVLDYFADRIEKRNPSINAFVYTKIDEAREEAKLLETRIVKSNPGSSLPLAGVPVGLKDFLPSKKGWTASHGGVASLITTDTEDSQFYHAAKALGAIAVGKTNAPSFGFRGTTDNKMYGPTCNPFNTKYNSGGSSGGSCAAVGGGLVPISECGDAGGSTRIPSAWCNCFGFKPSAGLVPSVCRPDAWTATHPYCCGGPATRTVEDAALILDMMQGFDPRDPLSVPLAPKHFRKHRNSRIIKDLKICYTLDFNLFPSPEPEIVNAIENAVEVLQKCSSQSINLVSFDWKHTRSDIEYNWLLGISIDDAVSPEIADIVASDTSAVPAEFLEWHEKAKLATMQDYRHFHEIRTDILDVHQNVFDDYDIILAPVTGCMPVKNSTDFNTKGPSSISGQAINELIGFGYTYLENMTGCPAASVPIGLGSNNLPIGLQVIGRRYFDEDVFTISYALEKELPWIHYYSRLEV